MRTKSLSEDEKEGNKVKKVVRLENLGRGERGGGLNLWVQRLLLRTCDAAAKIQLCSLQLDI